MIKKLQILPFVVLMNVRARHLLIGCLIIVGWFGSEPVLAQKNKGIVVDQPARDCGTLPPPPEKVKKIEDAIKKKKAQSPTPLVKETSIIQIPIKAHIVRRSNGTSGLSVEVLNSAIATMNGQYLPMNMQFYLCGPIHYIDDDNLSNCDIVQDDKALSLHNVNDALNIYFTDNLTSGNIPLNGISAFPSDNPLDNRIIMSNRATSNGSTLAHEVGHYWNLYHTHETYFGAELVTRGAGTNCISAGDLVCDTPADPYSNQFENCVYHDTEKKDANGELYSPDMLNLMSYYQVCRNRFTDGQFNRMADGYLYRKTLMDQSGAYNLSCQPEVAAPTQLSATYENCSVVVNWADNSDSEAEYIIERSASAGANFVAVGRVAANVTQYLDRSIMAQPDVAYYYRVVAANSNAVYSTPLAVTFDPTATYCYCIPGSTKCNDFDIINRFTIKYDTVTVLDFSSGNNCSTTGYNDFTAVPSFQPVARSTTYNFTIQNPGKWPQGITIWLDFNQNQLFEVSEIAYQTPWFGINTSPTFSGTLAIPDTAKTGTTRLRVRLQYNKSPTDPCAGYDYGETEDYAITIVPEKVITSVASGGWNAAETWSCGCVPTLTDKVVLETGHTVTVGTGTVQLKSLVVKDGAALNFEQDAQLNFQE